MRFYPSTLQRRFLSGLIVILLVTSAFFLLMLQNHVRELFLSEAHSKAGLMTAHTEAIQNYVRTVLRPVTSGIVGEDEFIIEAMSSSYVTRHILSGLNFEDKDFTYRRVAKNARNPDYEVNAREAHFFQEFLDRPAEARIEEKELVNGRERLVVARPVYFTDSCMRCHGNPKDAPAVLLSKYGGERGFWRNSGELAGLDIISVPMESATSAIGQSVTVFAVCFSAGMLLLLLSVQGFFNRLVVHNLRRVGHILHQNFFQEEDKEMLAPLHKEVEIEGMIRTIETVAVHLSEARSQLSDYARNLEGMVKERTADLEAVVSERSADVHLFMRLLSDLNNTHEKQKLLRTSLRLIAGHFSADRAVYVCGLSGSSYIEWPDGQGPGDKKALEEYMGILHKGEAAMFEDAWHIPVQTSGQGRGMLVLHWNGNNGLRNHSEPGSGRGCPETAYFPLAQALGRQLGIALDNLDAIDVLLRQNSLLDSIVEGVREPLILVERNLSPVLTNQAARDLGMRLLAEGEEVCMPTAQGAQSADTACITALLRIMGISEEEPEGNGLLQREVILADGSSFAVSIQPLAPNASGGSRSVIHLRETTEEKRILVHMRQSEKLAAVGQLAAGLAHEINNPLGVIRCYAELMSNAGLDEQSRSDLHVILRHVDHAQSVLLDMLDFSRLREICPGPCDINELLTTVCEVFSAQGRTGNARLLLDAEPGLPLLDVDKHMLERVLVNLLLNAKDAVQQCGPREGGRIILRARHERGAGEVRIAVMDNGPGIPGRLLNRIFEPFFTTKEPGAGTGLGLSIAFGMVNDMGGRLEARSPVQEPEPGRGTAFYVSLPVSRLQEHRASHAANTHC